MPSFFRDEIWVALFVTVLADVRMAMRPKFDLALTMASVIGVPIRPVFLSVSQGHASAGQGH